MNTLPYGSATAPAIRPNAAVVATLPAPVEYPADPVPATTVISPAPGTTARALIVPNAPNATSSVATKRRPARARDRPNPRCMSLRQPKADLDAPDADIRRPDKRQP